MILNQAQAKVASSILNASIGPPPRAARINFPSGEKAAMFYSGAMQVVNKAGQFEQYKSWDAFATAYGLQ